MMKLSLLSLVLSLSNAVATPCMYPSSDACSDDQYCAIEAGKCALRIAAQPGACAPKGSMACPHIMAPVCGCDMITYDNDCLAAAAGVNVITDGPCSGSGADTSADVPAVAQGCTFPGGEECGDNQYCDIEDGKCALRMASQPGTCASKGAMACPYIMAPVCGCDMTTYDNDCLAAAAGVNVITDGPCSSSSDTSADSQALAQGCTFPGGEECGDNQYCAIEDGKCALRMASQPGMCASKGAMACPFIMAPVCGCDMITYDNDCLAADAGVNVMTDGPCSGTGADTSANTPAVAQGCTFPGDEECGNNQYCSIEDGKCALRIALQPGTCSTKGTRMCPFIWRPVCGCNMITYDNDCYAAAAGVNVMASGRCGSGPPAPPVAPTGGVLTL